MQRARPGDQTLQRVPKALWRIYTVGCPKSGVWWLSRAFCGFLGVCDPEVVGVPHISSNVKNAYFSNSSVCLVFSFMCCDLDLSTMCGSTSAAAYIVRSGPSLWQLLHLDNAWFYPSGRLHCEIWAFSVAASPS